MLNFFIIFFVDYTCYSSKYYIQISDNDTLELGEGGGRNKNL